MNRKLWKTILYIIITIVISIFLYFNIVDSIHEYRFVKLANEAAEKAIESKDFSSYQGLIEKSYVSTNEKLYLALALFITTLLVIWYILKTSKNMKMREELSKPNSNNIVSLKRQYIIILVITLLISISYLYSNIKDHGSIAIALIIPINLLCILVIMYRIEYKHIETYDEDLGNFSSRMIMGGLFLLFLLIEFILYKLISLTGLDIIKWHF